jgi:small subunit ribosomal protein S14
MAKTSSVEKNNRRRKLVDQYAAKRAALKATVMDQSKPLEERFRAQLKLSSLPRNSAKTDEEAKALLTEFKFPFVN